MDVGWAALAHHLPAAPGTGAASQRAALRDVRSRRCASERRVGLSNVSQARIEMLRPVGRKFEVPVQSGRSGFSSAMQPLPSRGDGRRGWRTPVGPTPQSSPHAASALSRCVRHTCQRWQRGSRCAQTAASNARTPRPRPPSGARLTCSTRAPYRAPTPGERPTQGEPLLHRQRRDRWDADAIRANQVPCPLVPAARTRKEEGRQATSANVAIARSLGLGLWVHFAPVGGHHRAWLMRNTWPSG